MKTQDYEDIQIVIVDNGSGNGSAEKLREHFAARQRVHIVESPENLGFARGNNLGIRYAREHFRPILLWRQTVIFCLSSRISAES